MSAKRGLTFVLCLAAVASCNRPEDQRTDTMDVQQAIQQERESLPPDVLAQLDSGGAAFRADDHQGALTHYTKATELAPELAAAWFGVYMAHQALGDAEAAKDAFERAQRLEPGASLIHPTRGDTVP